MEVHDWVTLVSALIIVAGWFVNSWLNRSHEIAKKKLEHRLTALQSFIPFASSVVREDPVKNDPNFFDKLWTAYTNIQLYGTELEIELMNEMYGAFLKKDSEKAMKAYSKLYECVRSDLRKELNINS
jgi:hypothetical protein